MRSLWFGAIAALCIALLILPGFISTDLLIYSVLLCILLTMILMSLTAELICMMREAQ